MRLFWLIVIIVLTIVAGAVVWQYGSATVVDNGMQSNDTVMRFVYLGLIGLMAAAAIIRSGTRPGHILRYGFIWFAAAMVLMIGYNMRYELQDLGHKLTAGLVPASPVSAFDEKGKATVMLRLASNGHFAANAEVDGRRVYFMIDTGASGIVLTNRDARRLGIDTASLTYNMPVSTANGQTQTARVVLDSVKVGIIERQSLYAQVSRPGDLDVSLLGMTFLNRLSGYSVRGDRMILVD